MGRQLGLGFGKGRPHVIKTIVTGEALQRAIARHKVWLEQHGVEDAAPEHLRMAKADLRTADRTAPRPAPAVREETVAPVVPSREKTSSSLFRDHPDRRGR